MELGKTESSVGSRALKLRSAGRLDTRYRILPDGTIQEKRSNGWTEEHDDILWREWGLTPDEVLCKQFGRTLVALSERAYTIGASKHFNRRNGVL